MNTITAKPSLAIYTFSHFCVDFVCFYILFARFAGFANSAENPQTLATGFLIYNVIAFGTQPVVGYICDIKPSIPAGAAGCAAVLAALLIPSARASLIICAAGNSLFHIGGGIDSLVNAGNKIARSGVFVSSGAAGVALGTLAGKNALPLHLPALFVTASLVGVLLVSRPRAVSPIGKRTYFKLTSAKLPLTAVLTLCLISVIIRAYAGSILPMGWRTNNFLFVLPAIMACAGKALGGFIADTAGARVTGTVSLLASIPLLVLGNGSPFLCAAGIALFNMSMSVTLCAAASTLPYNPGLAFGLTTLGLLCGSVPTFFFVLPPRAALIVIFVLTLISAACVYFAVLKKEINK